MRSHMESNSFGSIDRGAYLGISCIIVFRKLSVVKSSAAKPTIANCSGRSFSSAKLQRAGTSLRLVRSPVAPQIVITQGEASEFVSEYSWFMRKIGILSRDCDCPHRFLGTCLLLDVPAKLKTHGRKHFGRKIIFAARCESLIKRGAKNRRGRGRFNRGKNC